MCLLSVSLILTMEVSLMYSPTLSRPKTRAGFEGVNVSRTLSSYSSVMKSSRAEILITPWFVICIGEIRSKSEEAIKGVASNKGFLCNNLTY